MELFCMHCQGIGPHLVVRGKSHGFSRIAGGTWVIISVYGGDGPSKLVFVQQDFPLSQSPGISFHLEMICSTWSFPRVAVLNLMF